LGEINRLNGALSECENRPPKVVEKVVVKEAPVQTALATAAVAVATKNGEKWVVSFTNGSAKLSNEAKFVLDQVGNDAIVDVTATATPIGGKEYNQKLSERRAKAVADYLTNRGVKVNSAVGKGADAKSGKTAVVSTLQ